MRDPAEQIRAARLNVSGCYDPTSIFPVLQAQIEALQRAIKIHGDNMRALRAEETINETAYTTRRQSLRIWNRGAQCLARETRSLFPEDIMNGYTTQIDRQITDLEFCRMCILDPYAPESHPQEDRAEWTRLSEAL
jgi:hypothetical protein